MTAERALPQAPPAALSVEDLVKQYIVTHALEPGDPLPTENELCAALGVSRSRVREAMKTLSALDIVEVRRGFGTYVGRMRLTALVESLVFRGMLEARSKKRHVLGELIDLRELLEVSLAGAMIDGLDDAGIAALRALTDDMTVKAARDADFRDEDREFHLRLMRAAGSDLAEQLVVAFWDVHAVAAAALGPEPDRVHTALCHERIVDALAARDTSGLVAAVRAHYEPVRRRMAEAR